MTQTITDRERATYDAAWGLPQYATYAPGEGLVPMFIEMAQITRRALILDAGCGSGKGALALSAAGHDVRLLDMTDAGLEDAARALPFAQACLWHDWTPRLGYLPGGKVDWVYCCDVLEHIPTPFTMLVVARLLAVARRGVFLSIALGSDNFGAWVGKPLHQTVQSFTDWREQLREVGRVVEARDCLVNGIYLVEPR